MKVPQIHLYYKYNFFKDVLYGFYMKNLAKKMPKLTKFPHFHKFCILSMVTIATTAAMKHNCHTNYIKDIFNM